MTLADTVLYEAIFMAAFTIIGIYVWSYIPSRDERKKNEN